MKKNDNLIGISFPLEKHPIINETLKNKLIYLNLLEKYINLFFKKKLSLINLLNIYKENILGENINKYIYNEEISLKQIFRFRIKFFKIYSFRIEFISDVFFIFNLSGDIAIDKIFEYLKSDFPKHKKMISELYNAIIEKNNLKNKSENYLIECLKKNIEFRNQQVIRILFLGNMSSGKSTLLNAIVGKKVNKTQNKSCTAQIHYIYNKPYEDNYIFKLDEDNYSFINSDILDNKNIENLNNSVSICTFFRNIWSKDIKKICLIDTPGVNSSFNKAHKEVTQNEIKKSNYDKIVYVINGENLGTNDEKKYLEYIRKNTNCEIIFVLNKLDKYKINEDSIKDSIKNLKIEFKKIGFNDPRIYPISAYVAEQAKKKIYGREMNKYEIAELDLFLEKFNEEEYNFYNYFSKKINIKNEYKYEELLLKTGIHNLEEEIYLNKKRSDNDEKSIRQV